jgi:CheY-like chemotaxis protein
MKILYVEDNDDNVYMLKNRLARAGFTVVVATNGAVLHPIIDRAINRDATALVRTQGFQGRSGR